MRTNIGWVAGAAASVLAVTGGGSAAWGALAQHFANQPPVAKANPRLKSSNPTIRQQQVIADPAADGSLPVMAARLDLQATFSGQPAGYDADALVDAITVTSIDPFTLDYVPNVSFSGNTLLVDDIAVTAGSPPPPGPVDFATIVVQFGSVLSQAEYNNVTVKYAFVLDTDPTHPSFIRASDGEESDTYGPGGEGMIDESEFVTEELGEDIVPEPAGAATFAAAAAGGLLRRRRRVGGARID